MARPSLIWCFGAALFAACGQSHVRDELDGGRDATPAIDAPGPRDAARDGASPRDVCVGYEETCDALDGDCDGRVDEGASCSFPHALGSCVRGRCELGECEPGFADCDGEASDGCEIATSNDRQNCGACSVFCGVTEACERGTCERERIVALSVSDHVAVVLDSGRLLGWGDNRCPARHLMTG